MTRADHIISGDYLLTMDGNGTVIADGALVVKDGRIVAVGGQREIAGKYEAQSKLGGRGKAVFPGLINTHRRHAPQGMA
jgi:cytosine/adenosine deaminase-related metal-dependent hydrolase